MKRKRILILLITTFLFCYVYAQQTNDNILFEYPDYILTYQLSKPNKTWKLPKILNEISGIAYIDKNRLACVQDEKGSIFIYNTKHNNIEREISFGEKGDYEDIEIVGSDAWILKSNGNLYRVKDFMSAKNVKVKKYKTALSKTNNTEGLTYDPHSNALLIACKGFPFVNEDDHRQAKEFKTIYRFDLKTKKLDSQAFLTIELDGIKKYKRYNTISLWGIELLALFDPSEGDVSFQPSGIAIHPISGNLFVLASVGNTLSVFSENGKMLALVHLKSKIHKQAEGICFSPDGTLYISNEGGDGKGLIMKFFSNSKEL